MQFEKLVFVIMSTRENTRLIARASLCFKGEILSRYQKLVINARVFLHMVRKRYIDLPRKKIYRFEILLITRKYDVGSVQCIQTVIDVVTHLT